MESSFVPTSLTIGWVLDVEFHIDAHQVNQGGKIKAMGPFKPLH